MGDDESLAPLTALLEARDISRDLIEFRVAAGPSGTELVTAVSGATRPGAGLVTAVRAGRRLYSSALGHGFGALATACGWHHSPPSASEILTALAYTDFDGQLQADGPEPLALTTGHGLRLTGSVRRTFDDAPRHLTLDVKAGGHAAISFAKLKGALPDLRSIDAVTEAVRTLDAGGVAAIGALRVLATVADPRAVSAIVRATTRWEEALWVEALNVLPADDPTVAGALADAWRALDQTAVAERLEVADTLRGATFTGPIRAALAAQEGT
jgi:hypothetical protein